MTSFAVALLFSRRRAGAKTKPKTISAAPVNSARRLGPIVAGAWTAAILFALALALIYANSLHCPFIFDGRLMIEHDARIRHLWPLGDLLGGSSRPLTKLTFALNYFFGKNDVVGYHAVNVLIHFSAALALFGLIRRTLLSPRLEGAYGKSSTSIAFAASLLWLVHPMQTESVTYIYQRAESMMGLFYLLTLYSLARVCEGRGRSYAWRVLSVCFCALGMGSKAVMMTAPLMALAYDRIFWSDSWTSLWKKRRFLHVAIMATWAIVGLIASGHNESLRTIGSGLKEVSPFQYASAQPAAFLHYVKLSLWPDGLVLDYGWPRNPSFFTPLSFLLTASFAASVAVLIRYPRAGFLGLWFFLILAPTSSIFPIADPVVEHRMYLPLAAVILAAVFLADFSINWLFSRPQTRRVFKMGALVAAAAVLCAFTVDRNHDYRSRYAVWRDVVSKRPNNLRAHINLANILTQRQEYKKAVRHCRIALMGYRSGRALTRSSLAKCHYNLALALAAQNDLRAAANHYKKALTYKPDFIEARNNLALSYVREKLYADAVSELNEALEISGDDASLHVNLGSVFQEMGRLDEAIDQYRKALASAPDSADAHSNLGVCYAQKGDFRQAREHLGRAHLLRPSDQDIAENLREVDRLLSKETPPKPALPTGA